MNAFTRWWHTKVQTHLGLLIVALSGVELPVLALYQQDIMQFFGAKWGLYVYSGIRLAVMAAGALVSYRAKQVRSIALPAPAPEGTR